MTATTTTTTTMHAFIFYLADLDANRMYVWTKEQYDVYTYISLSYSTIFSLQFATQSKDWCEFGIDWICEYIHFEMEEKAQPQMPRKSQRKKKKKNLSVWLSAKKILHEYHRLSICVCMHCAMCSVLYMLYAVCVEYYKFNVFYVGLIRKLTYTQLR